ncbi:hypothetical protein P167DRAFT_282726 [Morchella conica CCBAS932]|uniref:Uncharacterized protein n=1 Tax=Morchella conica CCBAS932 TaxID=1392247 RepID=A0A3N4KL21_9PEZI|nr:hypothetical protein P167DRAFT_282726 [Morchella conica CCBAS932]
MYLQCRTVKINPHILFKPRTSPNQARSWQKGIISHLFFSRGYSLASSYLF